MAKKIIISFSGNPTTSNSLQYSVFLNFVLVPYANGQTVVDIDYSTLPIGVNIQGTIESTIDYLRTNYVYNKISYQQVDNTIEVLINYDDVSTYFTGNIPYSVVYLPTETYNLKYFIQYTNKVNDSYYLGIYGRNFQGSPLEVNGKISLDKGGIKDHLDSIRGTGLSVDLEASNTLNFEDLYSDNEQDYKVRLYKNSKQFFVGYLKPDGIFQSFTREKWVISLDCVDGLGALENLSFVKDNGLRFTGKMKALDIVYYCLKRTGIVLNINTSINIYYDGLTLTDDLDILSKIKMNSDRFFKVDDETIMSCEEVLKSVLDVFCACITQQDGEWFIFRPNELYSNGIVNFKRYDLDNNYIGLNAKNLNKSVGSQINNFYPHHCNGNQMIRIKGGVSAYRLGYKYGYVSGLMPNPSLEHDSSLNYSGWTIQYPNQLVNDPNSTSGLIIKNGNPGAVVNAQADLIPVLEGDLLTLKLSWSNQRTFFTGSFVHFRISIGGYYLKYSPANDQVPFEDAIQKSKWETGLGTWTIYLNESGNLEFPMPEIPLDGNLSIRIDFTSPDGGTITLSTLELSPTTNAKSEIGEFHTASRANKISSIVKENNTVYNGDNTGIIYLGAILKEDGLTATSSWFRKNFFESKPLLRIAAEDQLRISQRPTKTFTGDFYGYIPYLCLLDIDGINDKFMIIEYSYDTIENITTIKCLELFSAEISDLIYKFTYDYGNTVKPTITS
jgi:hypothetical protein